MISGKELALLLGVTPQALSAAVKRGHYCGEYDVSNWAVHSASGVVKGYQVPDSVMEEIASEKRPQGILRPNPPGSGRPPPAQELSAPAHVHSLLPPGQNYLEPVAALTMGHVTAKAIEADNAPAWGVLLVLSAATGVVFGGAAAGSVGSVLGAGVGAALMACGLLKRASDRVAGQSKDRELLPGETTRTPGATAPGGFHDTTMPATGGVTVIGAGAGSARPIGSGVEVFQWSSSLARKQ